MTAHLPAPLTPDSAPATPRFLDQLRAVLRLRHYSLRTEHAYVGWTRRYILFHGKRHPSGMGALEVEAFLSHLATERGVAAATQSQARAALLFLYKELFRVELPWLDEMVCARTSRRLPVVLTRREVAALQQHMASGPPALVAALLYGTGMRLLEGLRLRVKDVEFTGREIIVRQRKGNKDQVTVLPDNLILPLQAQLARAKALHQAEIAVGRGAVSLPDALAVKMPRAAAAWGWQWVFPSPVLSVDPRSGIERRHHLNESSVQKIVSLAARRAGID